MTAGHKLWPMGPHNRVQTEVIYGGYIVIKTHNADEIVNLLKYGYNGIWGRKGVRGGEGGVCLRSIFCIDV